ncbi:hypothetical protein POJ06DRAFT_284605 [Lipomyces tetrasporus]|uniref:Acid phosphatase n=1 Tax=Lipomyces tetrasporus TaxID=54092 RepID=A0AAD7VVN5_9ASCO|nr:uncharacterized protein POJ06DRAFT_284605 [Lipomyces tetrasporus]KAJ8103673.1 hypothetical protein POJ06DRAFT_284605 [Lipomyces tetrasporus]
MSALLWNLLSSDSVAVVLTALLSALSGTSALPAAGSTSKAIQTQSSTGPNGELYVPGQFFDRFFMIIGENMDFWDVEAQATFANLWKQARTPNYFAHIAATSYGWNSDSPVNITGSEEGISWAGYAEDYPITQGYNIPYAPEYANGTEVPHFSTKRTSASTSRSSRSRPSTPKTRCNNPYNAEVFWKHLKENKLPQFVYFTPNLLNDGHDTDASYFASYIQETWINTFYYNDYFNAGALNYISLDESGNTTGFNTVPGDNNNHIYAALWGGALSNRNIYDKYDFNRYNHSSIAATLEMNWWGETSLLGRNDTYAPFFAVPNDGTN